jgi:hypothetical protein
MATPRFFDRIADASLPFLDGVVRQDFRAALDRKVVVLEAPSDVSDQALAAGWSLSINLCARLYPQIRLLGDAAAVEAAAKLILTINPQCDVTESEGEADAVLSWRGLPAEPGVFASATGWNSIIDDETNLGVPAAAPAAMAAGAVAVGQVFRTAFADLLGEKGRRSREPGGFNLVSLRPRDDRPPIPLRFDIKRVHLLGAGAVGEAAVATLVAARAEGELIAIDDQNIDLPNLQRYVLTRDTSERTPKVDLVEAACRGSRIAVVKIPSRWGSDPRAIPGVAETVLVGVDSADARIAVQAGLPRRIYNGFTGPFDLGWSRHETFGVAPCLACLYWPTRNLPSSYEVIAMDIGEHPLRVLLYLTSKLPVGLPLQVVQAPRLMIAPSDAATWVQRALLDDLAQRFGISDTSPWAAMPLEQLYHEGICGGGLVRENNGARGDITVPLAHQSALAGVMLASQLLIAADASLSSLRPPEIEARYNMFGSPSQAPAVPRSRVPGCICSDDFYLGRYREVYQPMPQ